MEVEPIGPARPLGLEALEPRGNSTRGRPGNGGAEKARARLQSPSSTLLCRLCGRLRTATPEPVWPGTGARQELLLPCPELQASFGNFCELGRLVLVQGL